VIAMYNVLLSRLTASDVYNILQSRITVSVIMFYSHRLL